MSYWKWLLVEKNNVWPGPLLPWRIGLTAVTAANHIKSDISDKPYFPKPYYEGNYIFPNLITKHLKKSQKFGQTLYHTNPYMSNLVYRCIIII